MTIIEYCGMKDKKENIMADKKLIILRGLPGSGKSDKAKKLVGNGIIHSTDSYLLKMVDMGSIMKI